jgi:hypothetical protein
MSKLLLAAFNVSWLVCVTLTFFVGLDQCGLIASLAR